MWFAGFSGIVFLLLLNGSGLIKLILFSVVVAGNGFGRDVIAMVLVSFGSPLLGVLLTSSVVDVRIPVSLAGCLCFGLLVDGMVDGIGILWSCNVCSNGPGMGVS